MPAASLHQEAQNQNIFQRVFKMFDRAIVKIDVQEELLSGVPTQSPDFEQAKNTAALPFQCFIEQQSGLLVLISQSGYCLKFQLETREQKSEQISREPPRA